MTTPEFWYILFINLLHQEENMQIQKKEKCETEVLLFKKLIY